MNLSHETMDGILYGLRLASNPQVTARREAYHAVLRKDRAILANLPRVQLAEAIRVRRLWTVPEAFQHRSTDEMVEVIARCMRGRDRPLWLAALGIDDPQQPAAGPGHSGTDQTTP